MVPLEHVIGLSAILFTIGVIGVATRRNLIVILMSIELMLNSVNLAFVGFNRIWSGRPFKDRGASKIPIPSFFNCSVSSEFHWFCSFCSNKRSICFC